jgi:hypothetical protein
MASLCRLCSERREVPGQQKLDLKAHRELGVNLIKDLFHYAGILDQGVDRTRQKILHVEKLIGSAGQVQGRVIGFQYSRPDRGRVERKELRKIQILEEKRVSEALWKRTEVIKKE